MKEEIFQRKGVLEKLLEVVEEESIDIEELKEVGVRYDPESNQIGYPKTN